MPWGVKYTQLLLTVLITDGATHCPGASPIRLHMVRPDSTHTNCTNQGNLTSPGLGFNICEMGIVKAQASQRLWRGLSRRVHVNLVSKAPARGADRRRSPALCVPAGRAPPAEQEPGARITKHGLGLAGLGSLLVPSSGAAGLVRPHRAVEEGMWVSWLRDELNSRGESSSAV